MIKPRAVEDRRPIVQSRCPGFRSFVADPVPKRVFLLRTPFFFRKRIRNEVMRLNIAPRDCVHKSAIEAAVTAKSAKIFLRDTARVSFFSERSATAKGMKIMR